MRIRSSLALLLLAGAALAVTAQVQVRDISGSRTQVQPAQVTPSNELVMTLYDRIEALHQEVQTLRGIVEEQGYQLKKMQNEQKDRYLDIDRRLGAINNNPGSSSPRPAMPQPPALESSSAAANAASTVTTQPAPPPASVTATSAGKKASAAENDLDEQEIYRKALSMLLDEHKPEDAKAKAQQAADLFQTYIDNFPNGRLFANALYWQGEAFLVVANAAKARDTFNRLLADFPTHAKAAGALLKLGVAYKQLGEKAKASDTWKSLKIRYPDADEIGKADEYLKAL